MNRASPPPPCPACGSTRATLEDALSAEQILSAWRHVNVELSSEGRRSLAETPEVRRWRCQDCGLAHFDPVLPGNGAFYADLQRQLPDYYQSDRPAFARALRVAKEHRLQEVLDVGCGSGAFLDQAARAGLKTAGLDLNPEGVARCRERGHDVRQQTAAEFFAAVPDRRFDLVTSFEVMEHVPGPAEFFASAAALVRPGGALVFSVPNDEGLPGRARLIPHQWPPHHLTLWRGANLRALAARNRIEVVAIETDPLPWGLVRHFLELEQGLEHRLGRRSRRPGTLGPKLASWAYRLSGAQHWLHGAGTSVTLVGRRT